MELKEKGHIITSQAAKALQILQYVSRHPVQPEK
jgi:hypothetical protein